MISNSSITLQDEMEVHSSNSLIIRYRWENDRLRQRIRELAERLNVIEQAKENENLNKTQQKKRDESSVSWHAEHLYEANREANHFSNMESFSHETLSIRELPRQQVNSSNSIVGASNYHNTDNYENIVGYNDNVQTKYKSQMQSGVQKENNCANVYSEQKNEFFNSNHDADEHKLKINTEFKEIVEIILKTLNISEYLVKVFNAMSHCLTEPHDYTKCQSNLLNCVERCLRAAKRGKSCLERSDLNVNENKFDDLLAREKHNNKLIYENKNIDVRHLHNLVESLEEELSYCEMLSKNIARQMLCELREWLKVRHSSTVENRCETWKSIIDMLSGKFTLEEQNEYLHASKTELYKDIYEKNDGNIAVKTIIEDKKNEREIMTRTSTKSLSISTPHLDEGDCEVQ